MLIHTPTPANTSALSIRNALISCIDEHDQHSLNVFLTNSIRFQSFHTLKLRIQSITISLGSFDRSDGCREDAGETAGRDEVGEVVEGGGGGTFVYFPELRERVLVPGKGGRAW